MPREIDWNEVTELRERLESCEIQEGDCHRMLLCLNALSDLRDVTEAQKISLQRYAMRMFGFKTESARKITGKKKERAASDFENSDKDKPRSHGRKDMISTVLSSSRTKARRVLPPGTAVTGASSS